ncbi:hypothetical protein LOD99_8926 [Oopsacas minuta]|uniref:BED-type domain-containing protein n=1 Tax=Oopsacas minuta TaxID=111878 RepID=A0AAV7JF74_9METZ|nr:hypothetical protein LOD99_8926 [Oopsacas minuta]
MVEDSRFSASRLLDLFVIEKLTNTAKCSLCSSAFTYNSQKTGTSHMSRHITNKHPEEYNKMKRRLECRDGTQSSILRCFKKKTGLSAMPERRRLAMLISCGDHVLPLSYFESEFTRSLLRIESCSNRMDLRGEIRLITDEVRQEMKAEFQGTFMTIVCDGWKNSLTGDKFVSFLGFANSSSKPIYITSQIVKDNSSNAFLEAGRVAVNIVEGWNSKVIALLADNARSIQLGLQKLSNECGGLLVLRCTAHVMNLCLRNIFTAVPVCQKALDILNKHVANGTVPRYVDTRWNSRIVRMEQLIVKLDDEREKGKLSACLQRTRPILDVLNIAQEDTTTWPTMMCKFEELLETLQETGFDEVCTVIEKRRWMLENIVIHLINWLNGKTGDIDFEMTGKWLQLMKVHSDFDMLYDAREFGAWLEGDTIQHYPKLKVFEEQILNKIAVSEASVERLFLDTSIFTLLSVYPWEMI